MSSLYKNPITASQSSGTNSVLRTSVFGNNFSVLNIGGYIEVYNLSDLGLILTAETYPSVIQLSANTIPINFTKGSGSAFSPDLITLNSDNISSGRRRLGMQVFVQEMGIVYQYTIPNYETLWNNLSGLTGAEAVTQTDYTTTINNLSIEGQDFIDAWSNSTIEGVDGVLREDARWVIYESVGSTIYTRDGSLLRDRGVDLSTFTLNFSSETAPNRLLLSTSGISVNGNPIFYNDVTILGSATTYNQQTISVDSNVITLNANLTGGTSPYPGDSGVQVLRGDELSSIVYWSEPNLRWEFGVSGGTTNPIVGGSGTDRYVPLWGVGGLSLSDSFLNQPDGENTLKTISGSGDVGLKLDFTNNLYQFGDYGNTNQNTYISIDDSNKIITINTDNFEDEGLYIYKSFGWVQII